MTTHKKKFITAISIVSFVLLVSVALVWWIYFVWLAGEQERYSQNREEIAELEQRLSIRMELEREVQKFEDDLELISASLLDKEHVSEVIEDIELIAEQTGNIHNIRNIQEIRSSGDSQVEQFDFSLDLNGDFVGLLSFLENIRQMPYLTSVGRLSTSSSGEGITTSLTLKVYVK